MRGIDLGHLRLIGTGHDCCRNTFLPQSFHKADGSRNVGVAHVALKFVQSFTQKILLRDLRKIGIENIGKGLPLHCRGKISIGQFELTPHGGPKLRVLRLRVNDNTVKVKQRRRDVHFFWIHF